MRRRPVQDNGGLTFTHALLAGFFASVLTGCGADGMPAGTGSMTAVSRHETMAVSMSPNRTSPAAVSPAGAAGLPPDAIHLQPAAIIDFAGAERPMVAVTLFIPAGWKTEGGVDWSFQHMCTNGYTIDWQAVSPDGLTRIRILPHQGWEWSNIGAPPSRPGCQQAPYASVREYLEALVEHMHPGARLLDYRPRADVEREFAELNQRVPMPMGEMRSWVEAGEVLFAFREHGHEMRGTIGYAVYFSLSRMDAMAAGMGVMETLGAYAFPGWAVTAPDGQLDFAFFEALRKSVVTDPRWEARMNEHNAEIARAQIEGAAERSRIIFQSGREVSQIINQAWQQQQQSADRRAAQFGRYIRGVEQYRDPHAPGGTVELDARYGNAWRLNDGTYLLTNDVGFDPRRELQIEAELLHSTP